MAKRKTFEFEPYLEQKLFLEATEPEVMFSGAVGAGKSRSICEKIHFLLYYYPGNVGILTRRYFSDLGPTTLKTLLEEVIPPDHIIQHHKTEHRIVVHSQDPEVPSELYYRGLDRPTGIASMNLGFAAVDEAIEVEEDSWVMLETRLRLNRVPFHQLFTATNPGAPSHWLYKRFYVNSHDETGARVRRVINTNAFSNPHNPPAFYERLKRFSGLYKARFVDGQWVGAEGLVYGDFSPIVHVVDPFDIPADWARYRALDLGTGLPFVCLWAAASPLDGALYVYREIYMSNRTILDHLKTMGREEERMGGHAPSDTARSAVRTAGKIPCSKCRRDLLANEDYWFDGKAFCLKHAHELYGKRYQWTVSDHDLGERKIMEFEGGVLTNPAKKDVLEGIQLVSNRIARQGPENKPRAYFFRNTLVEEDPLLRDEKKPFQTTDEFGLYKWKKTAAGISKDEPVKENDHGMDALRYLVMQIDKSPTFKKVHVLDGWLNSKGGARRVG